MDNGKKLITIGYESDLARALWMKKQEAFNGNKKKKFLRKVYKRRKRHL